MLLDLADSDGSQSLLQAVLARGATLRLSADREEPAERRRATRAGCHLESASDGSCQRVGEIGCEVAAESRSIAVTQINEGGAIGDQECPIDRGDWPAGVVQYEPARRRARDEWT
jgi:hypothetical protein